MLRALSDILSNSSMQQMPRSLSTRAPLSSTISRVSGSCMPPTGSASWPDTVRHGRAGMLGQRQIAVAVLVWSSPQVRIALSASSLRIRMIHDLS